jgi:hypothetical protein
VKFSNDQISTLNLGFDYAIERKPPPQKKKEFDNLSINCALVGYCTKQKQNKILYASLILGESSRIDYLALHNSVATGGADKSLARPGMKQATETDVDVHISYL